MKKFGVIVLSLLVVFGIIALSVAPALAQFGGSTPTSGRWWVPDIFEGEGYTLQDVIAFAINIAFGIAGLVAVIYLIIGGFKYVTSGGNPDTVELAKGTILNAIIGLIVILIAFLIVQFILRAIGVSGTLIPGVRM